MSKEKIDRQVVFLMYTLDYPRKNQYKWIFVELSSLCPQVITSLYNDNKKNAKISQLLEECRDLRRQKESVTLT